jgi:predicted nuclease with TOPRIM domain
MKSEIERLKQLTNVYSDVHTALKEIAGEVMKLDKMRHELSEVLKKTRDEEKEIINKLEKAYDKKLQPNDILEIIKTHEQGFLL